MTERLKDMLQAEVVKNKDTREKLRKERRENSKFEFLVFIKSMCQNRVTVTKCKDHVVIIEKDTLTLQCKSILGTERRWVFLLDKFFKQGVITIELTEKWFNLLMLNIKPGPFEIHMKPRKKIVLNRKNRVEFTEMTFEEVATWSRKDENSYT